MRMFRMVALAAASFTAIGMAAPVASSAQLQVEESVSPRPTRRRRFAAPAARRYRNKGPQARPKRKRNMVTHSRRVRRKHRRAA